MKLKILHVAEVVVSDSESRECDPLCTFYEGQSCTLFKARLAENEQLGYNRLPQCLAASGNHNILGKCLAGE